MYVNCATFFSRMIKSINFVLFVYIENPIFTELY